MGRLWNGFRFDGVGNCTSLFFQLLKHLQQNLSHYLYHNDILFSVCTHACHWTRSSLTARKGLWSTPCWEKVSLEMKSTQCLLLQAPGCTPLLRSPVNSLWQASFPHLQILTNHRWLSPFNKHSWSQIQSWSSNPCSFSSTSGDEASMSVCPALPTTLPIAASGSCQPLPISKTGPIRSDRDLIPRFYT